MKSLTSYLPEQIRSAVRFVIVGTLGSVLQYLLYLAFLWIFEGFFMWDMEEEPIWVNVAFGLGFGIEMLINYVATCLYTFSRRPDWKNAGGFMLGRVFNFAIQLGILNLLILDSIAMDEKYAGMVSIVIAGIINYFILRFFFKKK